MAINKTLLITPAMKAEERRKQVEAAINQERDRRIDGGFVFGGVRYQSRPEDRENIAGAKSAALDAIALGAQEGDYSWQRLLSPDMPNTFVWIAEDNSLHPMCVKTVIQFAHAAMVHKRTMIFAARTLKDSGEIPQDCTKDEYWP